MPKKTQNKVGRPSKNDESTLQKLYEAFALGCTDLEACLYADISSATLYNFQKNDPQFLERKDKLKQSPVLMARKEVVTSFTGNPELALKFLERKKKDEFSLRQELSGVDGEPIEVKHSIDKQLDKVYGDDTT